jgi:hypothetical protein
MEKWQQEKVEVLEKLSIMVTLNRDLKQTIKRMEIDYMKRS